MLTETYDVATRSGRTVAVWRSAAGEETRSGPVVVVAPGFGQRMRSAGAIALMMVENGATVYRFDSLDHVGISDGDIHEFCITAHYEALAAVVEDVCAREERTRATLVATSLAALPGVQFAAKEGRVDNLVLMLGVVNGRNTLREVLDADYLDVDDATLPEQVLIDKHWVDPRPIHREHKVVDWWDEPATVTALSNCDMPVCNFVAVDDDWVDIADVRRAFGGVDRPTPPEIVEVALSGHALLRNPVALKAMMTEVTRRALALGAGDDVAMPSFEAMVELRGVERELERTHAARRVP
jgi:acyl transferase